MKRLAMALCVLGLAGCGGSKIQPGRVDRAQGSPAPPHAAIVELAIESHTPRVDVVGSVSAAERVKIASRLQAEVREVRVHAGQRVAKDDVLLVLDDREIQEQLAAAEAQLRQAEADYKRTRQLFEARSASEQELTAAESAFHSARAQVERVRVLQSYTVIRAPLSGVIIERHVEVGDLAAPGMVLMAMYDPIRMRLEAPVPVRLIPFLPIGSSVNVELEHPNVTLVGRVAEVVGEIDPRSRTQIVRVDMDRPQADLLPGAFGRLGVFTTPRPALFAPASAVQRVGQLEFVNLVRDGRVIDRLVRTGPAHDGRVEILSGLSAGDTILAEARR